MDDSGHMTKEAAIVHENILISRTIRPNHFSRDMRFPTMLYVRPAQAQTSLHIRAV